MKKLLLLLISITLLLSSCTMEDFLEIGNNMQENNRNLFFTPELQSTEYIDLQIKNILFSNRELQSISLEDSAFEQIVNFLEKNSSSENKTTLLQEYFSTLASNTPEEDQILRSVIQKDINNYEKTVLLYQVSKPNITISPNQLTIGDVIQYQAMAQFNKYCVSLLFAKNNNEREEIFSKCIQAIKVNKKVSEITNKTFELDLIDIVLDIFPISDIMFAQDSKGINSITMFVTKENKALLQSFVNTVMMVKNLMSIDSMIADKNKINREKNLLEMQVAILMYKLTYGGQIGVYDAPTLSDIIKYAFFLIELRVGDIQELILSCLDVFISANNPEIFERELKINEKVNFTFNMFDGLSEIDDLIDVDQSEVDCLKNMCILSGAPNLADTLLDFLGK